MPQKPPPHRNRYVGAGCSNRMRAWTLVLLLTATVLAGCSDAPAPAPEDPGVVVTETTGGVRGVVVDSTITPLTGVNVMLSTGETAVTDETGAFTFSKLEPNTYFVLVTKAGYQEIQSSFQVAAGKVTTGVRIQLARLPGVEPMADSVTFDGFYECGYAIWVQTDSCDWVIRTAHDGGATVVPRGVQNNVNTAYYDLPGSATTLVQEGFFDDDVTSTFWFTISSTPIDNLCDCSDTDYLSHQGTEGYSIGRLDRNVTAWPALDAPYAVRGFLPFQEEFTDVDYAFNVQFQIITTTFHNWTPVEGWNFADRDMYPAP